MDKYILGFPITFKKQKTRSTLPILPKCNQQLSFPKLSQLEIPTFLQKIKDQLYITEIKRQITPLKLSPNRFCCISKKVFRSHCFVNGFVHPNAAFFSGFAFFISNINFPLSGSPHLLSFSKTIVSFDINVSKLE